MRWLVAAVVVMGVLILGATGVLVATLVTRFHVPGASCRERRAGRCRDHARRAGGHADRGRLGAGRIGWCWRCTGGGPDRVVVIDPAQRAAPRPGRAGAMSRA